MAKLVSISLMDEVITADRLLEALTKLSSRDLRKYFKRKKMAFPRSIRYAFLTKCIKRDFQAVPKDLLAGESRVFTEFELVEFYKCVENAELAKEFKKDFVAYFVKNTYKNLLTDKNLSELYQIAESKEEASLESIHSFLVGLNPIFADTEDNNLDCLPVETTAQRIKDQFTLFEVREFAKKYGVVVPKYPNSDVVAPVVIEKARAKQLLDEPALENLANAEVHTLMSFAKKNRIYAPRYVKKDEVVDEVISQIASKEINNARMNEVFNENLITFKSRSSSDSLCDLLDKYENLDDLSEVRNDNSKDMSPIKRCAVGGAIGLELKYNEETRKARLQARREKLEVLRQQALERKERLAREKREQDLINQRDTSLREREEEEAKRLAAEQRVAELEALLARQEADREAERLAAEAEKDAFEAQLREEEAKRIALEKALEEAPKYEVIEEPKEEVDQLPEVVEEVAEEEEEVIDVFGADEIIKPEYVETTVLEEYETEEEKEITYMAFETVEEEVEVPVPEVEEEVEVIPVPVVIEEPVEEEPVEEPAEEVEEETPVEEEPIEVIEEEPIEVIEEVVIEEEPEEEPTEEETPVEEPAEEEAPVEEPKEEEPKPEPVKCPVNKLHVKGWIWSVLVVAIIAALYFLVEPFASLVARLLANGEYTTIDFVGLYGVGAAAVGIVAFLIRFIFHKIGCKAKKGKACCKIGEIYKYLWTHLVVAVIAVFAFMQANLFHFSSTIAQYANILSKIFAGESLALDSTQALMIIFLILIVAYVVTLLICSLAHAIKCKKGSNPSVMRHTIIFLWSYIAVIAIVTVALVVVAPQVLTEVAKIAVENVTSVFNGTALVVNAAGEGTVKTGGPDVIALIFTALFAVVVIYVLSLVLMTIGYANKVKKQKETEQEAIKENRDEVEEIVEEEKEEETSVPATVEEEKVEAPAPVSDEKVVLNEPAPVEEEGEKLLFTTFEEAKLVEDLNDLNRMIGKVNEHVKDLSAIQARLYNELVGEEEIVIEPVRVEEEQKVVIPEYNPEPVAVPAPVVEEKVEAPAPVVEEKVEELPVVAEAPKVKPRCGVRTAQKVWWILFAVLVVALAVTYFVVPEVAKYINIAFNALKDTTGDSWTTFSTGMAYATIALVIIALASFVRTLVHPVGCRAKKDKKCRHAREFILYVWTLLIFAISAIVALYFLDIYKVKDYINQLLTFDFANFDKIAWLVLFGIAALVIIFAWLFIGSIRYANRDKIKAKKAAKKEAKKAVKEANKNAKLEAKKAKEEAAIEEVNSETTEDKPVEVVEEIKPKKEKKVKEPKAKKAKKAKVKCKVRTMQKVWFTLLVIVVVAAVVGYFTSLQPYYIKAIAALKDTTGASWGPYKTIGVYGALVLAVVVLAFLWRLLVHPCGCKVKKDRLCTKGREFVLFLWAALIIGVAAIVALYFLDMYRVRTLINSVLTFDFANFGKTAWVVFAALIALVVFAIILFIASIKTKVNEVRRVREAKAAKLEEEARIAEEEAARIAKEEEEAKMMYFPVIVGGELRMLPIPTMNALEAVAPQKEETKELAPVEEVKAEEVKEEPKVEEKPKKEKKVKEPKAKKAKVKCKVRTMQKVWFTLLVIVAIAAVVGYFTSLQPYYIKAIAALKDTTGASWGPYKTIGVYGALVLAVVVLAFLWRLLVHPCGCKVKKDRLCTKGREFVLFLWAALIIGVAAIVALYFLDMYRVRTLINSVLTFDFANFGKTAWVVFATLIALVVFAIILFIASIKTKVNEVRRVREAKAAKLEEEAEKVNIEEAQKPKGTFFPIIVDGQVQMIEVPTLGQAAPKTIENPAPVAEEPKVEEKPKKEKKVKEPKVKVNCKVRKTQKVWWILVILAVAVAAAVYFFAPSVIAPLMPYIKGVIIAVKDFDCNTWTQLDSVAVFGLVALAVLFIAFVWRTLVHPCGCKAKKDIPCTLGREFLLFLWTSLIIGVIVVVVFYYYNIYRVKDLINPALSFDFANYDQNSWVAFGGLVGFALLVLILIIASISSKVKSNKKMRIVKEAEIAEEEAKKQAEAQAQMQPNVSYFPMMINGQVQMIPVAAMNPVAPQEVLEEPKADKKAKKAKKEKKVKEPKVKVNCKVRKAQKALWIIAIIVAVIAAVALFLAPDTKEILAKTYRALTDFDGSGWSRKVRILVYCVVIAAVMFVAFVWRTLVHPITCKAKKEKHCCMSCEFISYVWTVIIIGVITAVALAYFRIYLVRPIARLAVDVIKNTVTFNFAGFGKKEWFILAAGVFAVVAFIIFVIASIKHKKECKKLERYEEREAELNSVSMIQQPAMNNQAGMMPPMMYPMQQPIVIYQQPYNGMNNVAQYNTGVYEDLNSPYNTYRINDEERGRRASKYHGKHRFLKFVFVVAVLAVAYVALAYFTKGLPGDDTIRNLVDRFIRVISRFIK